MERETSRVADWRPAAAVAAAAALAHGGALSAALLYDDQALLAENGFFDSFARVTALCTPDYFGSGELSWRPVATLSHLLEAAVLGRGSAALHAVSVGLHALNAALCVLLLRRLGLPALAATLGALVLAVHPALAEATLLVSFREDVLVTTFLLAGGVLVARGVPGWGRAVAVAACAAGALGSKETGLVFPACWALVAWAATRASPAAAGDPRGWWRLAATCAPVVAGYAALRFLVLTNPDEAAVPHLPGGVGGLVAADGWILWQYAALLAWPVTLLLDREVPDPVLWPGVVAGWALAVGLAAVAWRARGRAPGLAASVGWVAAGLAPVMNVVALSVPLAERFCYLPAVGVAWALACALDRCRAAPRVAIPIAAILALAAAWRCHARAADFADAETLWRATLAANPRSGRATSNLGHAIGRRGLAARARGDDAAARADFGESIRLHTLAAELDPRMRSFRMNRGVVLEWRGDLQRALGDEAGAREDWADARTTLRGVLAEAPEDWRVWRTVASVSLKLGDEPARVEALAQAEAGLGAVLTAQPRRWPDWLSLAEIREHRADAPGQLEALRRAVEAAPGELAPRVAHAVRLVQLGRAADAVGALEGAPAAVRDTASWHAAAVQARLAAGDHPGALDALRAGLARWPQDPELRALMGRLGPGR